MSLSACTGTKKQNDQENFEEFKNKFYSDSVFQMSRIKFPLPLKVEMNYDTINNKFIGDTLAWEKKDWVVFKHKSETYQDSVKWFYKFTDKDSIKIEEVGLKNTGFSTIIKYKLLQNKWYLFNYQVFNY
ncbi:MAG: hypothetical protein MUC49_11765 [Raineya sp.]|nr:hypothetical protein [Raineya sp.]